MMEDDPNAIDVAAELFRTLNRRIRLLNFTIEQLEHTLCAKEETVRLLQETNALRKEMIQNLEQRLAAFAWRRKEAPSS